VAAHLRPQLGDVPKKRRVERTAWLLPRHTSYFYGRLMEVAGFDLNLFKAFDALYAERHVTRAGQRIGLSQPAMSGALTRLREVFNDELFVRSPTGMQPTPRADDLAGPIAAALHLMRSVLQGDGFDPATADHIVTIAMTDYAAFVLLPPLLARLAVEAPRLEVRVRGIFGKDEVVDLSTVAR
jgi:DNA-binding transcriptional LysR family regulator